jgi:phospholipase/lecithinase/hemolysin
MSKLYQFRLALVTAAVIAGAMLASAAQAQTAEPFSKVVVFGDSLSDTGNVFFVTRGLIPRAPYFDGNFSNGPVWVEWLADELGLPEPTPFFLGGTNYAWGTAQTGPGVSLAGVPNVGTQIAIFRAIEGQLDGDELIVVLAGGNDALSFSKTPWAAARNMRDHIADLADAGGQVFVVPTLLGPGQTPLQSGTPLAPLANLWAELYNDALDTHLEQLELDLGIQIVRLDAAALTAAILADPAAFGFSNVTDPACPRCGTGIPLPGAGSHIVPNPDSYVWWDFVHPTRALHQLWGELAAVEVELAVE